jgi:hypothetical protein
MFGKLEVRHAILGQTSTWHIDFTPSQQTDCRQKVHADFQWL